MKVAIVISAAGMSTRHPPNKLLIRLGDQPVIVKTISTFIDLGIDIFVVVGHQKSLVKNALSSSSLRNIKTIHNPDYKLGMSTSIKAAVRQIRDQYDYLGFSNGDLPFISTETVSYLLKELYTSKPLLLAPSYNNRIGHPVFFCAELFDELELITGDKGGREIIKKHRGKMLILPVEDEGVIMDMDYYLEKKYV